MELSGGISGFPTSTSNTSRANAQISVWKSTHSPWSCSGLMRVNVPTNIPGLVLPPSARKGTLASLRFDSGKPVGFRSPWGTPLGVPNWILQSLVHTFSEPQPDGVFRGTTPWRSRHAESACGIGTVWPQGKPEPNRRLSPHVRAHINPTTMITSYLGWCCQTKSPSPVVVWQQTSSFS